LGKALGSPTIGAGVTDRSTQSWTFSCTN